jgi:hypothetical protein
MVGFAAQRLMELEVGVCGYKPGFRERYRLRPPIQISTPA